MKKLLIMVLMVMVVGCATTQEKTGMESWPDDKYSRLSSIAGSVSTDFQLIYGDAIRKQGFECSKVSEVFLPKKSWGGIVYAVCPEGTYKIGGSISSVLVVQPWKAEKP